MMHKFIRPPALGIMLLAISLFLILAACDESTSREIRIGLIAPISGDFAATTGLPAVDAARLAVAGVNEAGGLEVGGRRYTITLVVEDDQGNPETAVSAAQKLINQEGVAAIVGPFFSSNAIPVAEIAEQARIPMISPTSTNPQTTAGQQYAFRATFLDDFQGMAMARFTVDDLKIQQAAVLYDIASDYNRGLAEAYKESFEGLGGQIVAFEPYTTDQNQDFSQQLAHIQASNADALFLPNYTDDVLRQGQQAHELGIEAIILGSDAWEGERISGDDAFENAYFSGHFCRDQSVENIRRFSQEYEQEFGREPNGLIALTYDSFGFIFAALQEQKQATPEAIRAGLYNISYQGITGLIDFEDTGDPIKSVAIWHIEDGDRVCHKLVSP